MISDGDGGGYLISLVISDTPSNITYVLNVIIFLVFCCWFVVTTSLSHVKCMIEQPNCPCNLLFYMTTRKPLRNLTVIKNAIQLGIIIYTRFVLLYSILMFNNYFFYNYFCIQRHIK